MENKYQNIFIVGLPGSGKSTLGKQLAHALHYTFEDADESIEAGAGLTISDIFEKYGENHFRELENIFLKNFNKTKHVIATGGGMPCFYDNMSIMKEKGMVVYLMCSISVVIDRLKQGGFQTRPLFYRKKPLHVHNILQKLLLHREEYYRQAELIVDCQQTENNIVKLIHDALKY